MKMRSLALACWVVLLPTVADAAAPRQLYGKTVVITSTEARTQHAVGGGNPISMTASTVLSVYVSTAGRPFVRSDRTIPGNRRPRQRAMDTAPDGGSIGVSRASSVQFAGNTMVISMQFDSGARRITATFDGSFGSCTATAINGREGNRPMVIRSRFTGQPLELDAIRTTVGSCTVREGNAFAGQ